MGKRCPDFGPGIRGGKQPPERGTDPAGPGYAGGEGRVLPSLLALVASPSPLTHPTPFLPMGLGARGGPGPPRRLGRGYGTGCRGEVVCPSGCECQKPCSYGAAPHRDQRALGSATRPSFPTRRLQGTSKGKIQTQNQRAGEGSPPTAPSSPRPGGVRAGIAASPLSKGRLPFSCEGARSPRVPLQPDPAPRLPMLCSSLRHSRSSFNQGRLWGGQASPLNSVCHGPSGPSC